MMTATTVPPGTAVDSTGESRWVPVRVTAVLAEPVVALDTNPLHLDGPLSHAGFLAHTDAHGHHSLPPMRPDEVADFSLPLAVWTRPAPTADPHPLTLAADPGQVWGWACSAAHWTAHASTVVSVRRRPAVEQMARYTRDASHHLSTGPLKARDVPHQAAVVREIVWWALADLPALEAMLARVIGLGRVTRHGNGRVQAWTVTRDESARHRWLRRRLPHPGGRTAAIRAPYHHVSRLMPCAAPEAPSWG